MRNENSSYRIIEHTADIGIEVWARSLLELFKNAALAFFDLLAGLDTIGQKEQTSIQAEAENVDELMVAWLGELLYLFDSDGWLFRDFQLELKGNSIRAIGRGEKFNPHKHEIRYYVKAVTYHMLEVKQTGGRWKARIIFDI